MSHTIVRCPGCGSKNRIPTDKLHLSPKCGRCGASLEGGRPPDTVVVLSDANFHQLVEQESLPVLVDFYSPTCGPCQAIAPVIENVAARFAGRVVVGKLDTSVHQQTAARFQIRGVPSLLFFRNGKVADQLLGAVGRAEIEQRLNRLL